MKKACDKTFNGLCQDDKKDDVLFREINRTLSTIAISTNVDDILRNYSPNFGMI